MGILESTSAQGVRRRIVIAAYGPSDGIEMIRLGRALTRDGRMTAVFCLPYLSASLLSRLGAGLSEFQLFTAGGRRIPHRPRPFQPGYLYPRMLRALGNRAISVVRKTAERIGGPLWQFCKLLLALRTARAMLRRLAPQLVVLPLEAVGHHSALLAAAAKQAKIPVLVVPYSVPINLKEVAERWASLPAYNALFGANRPISQRYPQWVISYQGIRLLRLTRNEILAHEWAGIAPSEPWQAGGWRFADAIAIESAAMAEYYRQEGFPDFLLKLTGSVTDDELARALAAADQRREDLYRQLGLPSARPMILFAVMPDFIDRARDTFSSYKELIHFIFSSLIAQAGDRFNIVVRLHPSADRAAIQSMLPSSAAISDWDTACLIPLAEAYVASVSATIRWAIACGVPTINYDVYGFNYHDYDDVQGVLTITSKEAFHTAVARLFSKPDSFTVPMAERVKWGVTDGRAVDRIAALAEILIRDTAGEYKRM